MLKNVENVCVKKKFSPRKEVLSFTYPKRHCTKTWYVDFFCIRPGDRGNAKKKILSRLNKKLKERRQRGTELIEALLKQLRSSWNLWVSSTKNGAIHLANLLLRSMKNR